LRPDRFVTRKVVAAACRIADHKQERLHLGNVNVQRDWGWAPEYVDAMWRMLQQPVPQDYVIATGETNSLERFVSLAFEAVGLDWKAYVDSDPSLMRTTDLLISRANPAKAAKLLNWHAQIKLPEIVQEMIDAELSTTNSLEEAISVGSNVKTSLNQQI
jgi:GDPmannose 4,6-dehydratase